METVLEKLTAVRSQIASAEGISPSKKLVLLAAINFSIDVFVDQENSDQMLDVLNTVYQEFSHTM